MTYTLYAEKLDSNNWTALADWKGITKNSCTVDLEKYQGVTLRFYVVANAVDGKKYCSPNGEYSNLLIVEKRLAAPVVHHSQVKLPDAEPDPVPDRGEADADGRQ